MQANPAIQEPPEVPQNEIVRARHDHIPDLMRELDFGPVWPLIQQDDINDILINGVDSVYIEKQGTLHQTPYRFERIADVEALAHRIAKSCGREIGTDRPLVDARLPDGSRVNIVMPPMAIDGAVISIRKFPTHRITLEGMIQSGSISPQLGAFLKICGSTRVNIVISGGTGAGKTTLLNALSHYISPKERIVTIEDSAELQLQQPHVVRLETKMPTRYDYRHEEVSIRDLVKNALRMRPDRIIVGEVRGAEAFDMMQAMNTGHDGSLATLHANTPRDALSRLENMINMSEMQLTQKFIRQQIASAIQLIIQINRMDDGSRHITHVSEVVGLENETIVMQDLFNLKVSADPKTGTLTKTYGWSGTMPRHKALVFAARESKVFGIG